ncbi:MAG TPA: DUF6709 family protein [Longilinea sp.]|nr:DUF6709 family protein [Longilinea sp.]
MIDGFVEQQIRRNNRSQILWALFILAVVIGAFVIAGDYYYNFFFGPFKVSSAQVISYQAGNLPRQYYVTVTGREVEDTGYDMYHTDNSGNKTTDASYMALLVSNRLLLVKVPPAALQTATATMTGALVDLPSDEQTYVIQNLESEYPNIKGAFLPVMLDTTDFKTNGYAGLVVGTLIAGICLFFIIRGIMRSDPERHPFMKQLARYGQPEFIASSIDMEMDGEHTRVGPLHVSPKWLVLNTLSLMKVERMEDLVWGYKLVTQHRTYGIPTMKTYSAMIYDRNGTLISVAAKEDVITQLLTEVKQHAPWMIAGYSKELADAWRKDRTRVIAAVDANKQGVQQV